MLYIFLICLYLTIKLTVSQDLYYESLKLTDILPDNYSRDSAPKVDGKPLEVYVSIVVLSLVPDSDADMV